MWNTKMFQFLTKCHMWIILCYVRIVETFRHSHQFGYWEFTSFTFFRMKTVQRIFVFYAIAFFLAYLTNLSAARPASLSEENVENGLQSLNPDKQDAGAISDVCPPWIARLPGGCRRLLRQKRSSGSKAGLCPPFRLPCPPKNGWYIIIAKRCLPPFYKEHF